MTQVRILVVGGDQTLQESIRAALTRPDTPLEPVFLAPDAPLDAVQGDFILLPWRQPDAPALLRRLKQALPDQPLFLLASGSETIPAEDIAGVLSTHMLPQLESLLHPFLEQQRLNAVHRLLDHLSEFQDIQEVLQFLPKATANLLGADGGIAMLRDPEDQTVLFPFGYNLPDDYTQTPIRRDQGLVWRTLLQRETLMLEDYSAHPEALPKGKAAGFRSMLAVPLLAGKATIGALAIFRRRVQPFNTSDRLIMELIGALAGAHLHDLRMSTTLLQQATELSLLHALSAIAAEAESTEELIERTTNLIYQHFLPSNCGILLVDSERNALVAHTTYRNDPELVNLFPIPLGEGVTGRVALSGRSERIDDVREVPYYIELDPAVRSELCVPIRVGGQTLGVINLESVHLAAFTPTDQALLESIARQLASSLEKLRLLDEERHRRHLAESLQAATTSLVSSLELDRVLNTILHLLRQVVPMDSGSVQLIEGDNLITAAVAGFDEPDRLLGVRHSLQSPLLMDIIRRREPLILEDAQQHPAFQNWVEGHPIRGWMCAPLIARGEVIGFLTLDSRRPRAFQPSDAALVQTFANEAALAIYNARLFQTTQQRTHELSTLYEIVLSLSASLDQEAMLQQLEHHLRRALAMDALLVLDLPENAPPHVLFASVQGETLHAWRQRPLAEEAQSPIRWVEASGQMLLVRDVEQTPLLGMYTERELKVHEWVALPMHSGQRLQGVLVLEYSQHGSLERLSVDFLQALANQVGILLAHARLYQEALADAQRWAILHWAGQEIAQAGLDLERVYAAVHQAARRLMPCDVFAITRYHAAEHEVEGVYLVDLGQRAPPFRTPAEHTLTSKVLEEQQALRIDDLNAYPEPITRARFGSPRSVRAILAVPMRVGERILGILSAQSYTPGVYSQEDAVRLEMLAAQAAVAIENAELYLTTERRALHLQAAAEVARDAAALDELDALLQRAVNLVRDRFGFYHAGIFLVDEAHEYAVLRAATGHVGRQMLQQGHRLKIGQTSIVGYVVHTGKARIADDVHLDRLHFKNPLLPETRAEMAVPLRLGSEVIGALDVQSRRERAFSPEDVAVLQTLADQLAVAIHNAQLFQRERRRRRALEALRRAGLRLTASLDLEHVTETILEQAMALSQAWDVHLFLYDNQQLHFVDARWREPEHSPPYIQPRPDGITYTVARSGEPRFIPDMRQSDLYQDTDWEGAIASLPLKISDRVRGVLNVAFNHPHPFDEDEIQVLQLLADQAAIALENAHLYRELEEGYIDTILALGRAVNARDAYTADHSHDLTELAVATAMELGCDETTIQNTRWAALLHDIGKIGIPDTILNKPGPLTPEERAIIEQHPDIGADIVAPIHRLAHLAPIIRAHQEKFDGSGYPRGLQGEAIPIEARIIAVVDAYSAIVDERVYKKGQPPAAAVEELRRCAGSHFDPQVVDAFLRILKQRGMV